MRWHEVQIPLRADFRFPADLCCNCGGIDDLRLTALDVRYTIYLLAGGAEQRATANVPFCPGCAPTAHRRTLGRAAKVVWWLMWWFASLCAVMFSLMALRAGLTPPLFGLIALGLAVVTAVGLSRWFGRAPTGARTSNYQPLRYHGLAPNLYGPGQPGTVWSFSNTRFAERVSQVVASLPADAPQGAAPRS